MDCFTYNLIYRRSVLLKLTQQGEILKKVLSFYSDITKEQPKFLIKNKRIKDSLIQLRDDKYYVEFWKKFCKAKKECSFAIDDLQRCIIFNKAERNNVQQKYIKLRNLIISFIDHMDAVFKNFRSSYQAELMAYGDYCIRNDEIMGMYDTD